MMNYKKITALLLAILLNSCGGSGGGGDSGTPGGSPPSTDTYLYFAASDGVSGTELWKTDGTEAGTVRVKDINPGAGSSSPSGFTVFNGALYFSASDGMSGGELWKTDGTEAGTVRVKDINPGAVGSGPSRFTVVNGALYFRADDGVSGHELWKTDGTESGTVRVKDIFPGLRSSALLTEFNVFNDVLYFTAVGSAGPVVSDGELWKTDGTEAGTVRVKDIYPGLDGSFPVGFTVFNGALYFRAYDGVSGPELWKTDGTEAGTVRVKDIWPGGQSSYPDNLTVFNGALYFRAIDGSRVDSGGLSPPELWKTDGTEVGTVHVTEQITVYPNRFSILNGAIYFVASNGNTDGELWKSDGTNSGTVRVKYITPPEEGYSNNFEGFTVFNGALYFSTRDGPLVYVQGTGKIGSYYYRTDRELWKTDGTEAGTVRVKDINPGIPDSSPSGFTAFSNALYFSANDGVTGSELWKTDGTEAGTVRVKDIYPGAGSSGPIGFTIFPQ